MSIEALRQTDWTKLLRVHSENFLAWFSVVKEVSCDHNNTIRFYSLSYNDGQVDYSGFINYLVNQIDEYVFDQKEANEYIEEGQLLRDVALSYFGNVDPIRDGRYGELILYLFTEAVLKTPLLVHKLSNTYNVNKQVEGSDGLFLGVTEGRLNLAIGEAKMRNNFSVCLSDAISSIERYTSISDDLKHEVKIAKKHLSRDLNNLTPQLLEQVYESLKPTKIENEEFEISHPVLLIHKEKKLSEVLNTKGEDELSNFLIDKSWVRKENSIRNASDGITNRIDVFLIPVDNVSQFREDLFTVFHNGQEYIREDE